LAGHWARIKLTLGISRVVAFGKYYICVVQFGLTKNQKINMIYWVVEKNGSLFLTDALSGNLFYGSIGALFYPDEVLEPKIVP